MKNLALGALVASSLAGCARQAIVSVDALPVKRVVVYRNGVAYFEREGHVDEGEVRFKMKPTEVGDFLATLAVMEHGGSSVRAAAFPLKVEESERAEDAPPPVLTEDQKKGLETVTLALDGKAHDLKVGYITESPVWRPSYRLVVRPAGQADLQAWGIVENVSGEDWKNVALSLVAGAPLTFRAELGTPVVPPRPTVTDQGEVIASVPQGETSLAEEESAAPEPPPPPAAAAAPSLGDFGGLGHGAGLGTGQGIGNGRGRLGGAPARSAPQPRAPAPSAKKTAAYDAQRTASAEAAISGPRNLQSLAAVAVEGGATRYDLPLPVTVPDRSATMVMLLSRQVSGEALFLFAPDGGVPDSRNHPFRVARFANATDGVLERGPIAVFEQGAFLGQGMVESLPVGATATVPFALERGIAFDVDLKVSEVGERVAQIENSQLTIERDRVMQRTYRVHNGGDAPAKLLIKHPRIAGARLFSPPPGTEDNVGTGSALVPATAPARATVQVVVDERTTERQGADWFSAIADNAIKAYLGDPRADRALVSRLATAWAVRGDIVKARDARNDIAQQLNDLSQATEETRRNLRAIEKNRTAEALRQKLTARLAETAAKLDDLNRKLVELDSKLAELGVRFSEEVREINVVVPAATTH